MGRACGSYESGCLNLQCSYEFDHRTNKTEFTVRQTASLLYPYPDDGLKKEQRAAKEAMTDAKYVGPLIISVSEVSSTTDHTVRMEKRLQTYELQSYTKNHTRITRKNVSFETGEEIEMDISHRKDLWYRAKNRAGAVRRPAAVEATEDDLDAKFTPVLFIRVDPGAVWLRQIRLSQPFFSWAYQLQHERDVVAQFDVWPAAALSGASCCRSG